MHAHKLDVSESGITAIHGPDDDAPSEDSSPRVKAVVRGRKALSDRRVESRAQDKRDLAEALQAASCSIRTAASALGVDESSVREWLDPSRPACLAAGDIEALPASVVRAYYAIKRARGAPLSASTRAEQALVIVTAQGQLAAALVAGDDLATRRATLALEAAVEGMRALLAKGAK